MRTYIIVETKLQELAKHKRDHFFAPESGEGDIFPVSENYQLAAKILKSNPVLIKAIDEAFQALIEDVVEYLNEDLRSIWQRLDDIEEKLPKAE